MNRKPMPAQASGLRDREGMREQASEQVQQVHIDHRVSSYRMVPGPARIPGGPSGRRTRGIAVPAVRQVLRSAPPAARTLPGCAPSPSSAPPRSMSHNWGSGIRSAVPSGTRRAGRAGGSGGGIPSRPVTSSAVVWIRRGGQLEGDDAILAGDDPVVTDRRSEDVRGEVGRGCGRRRQPAS